MMVARKISAGHRTLGVTSVTGLIDSGAEDSEPLDQADTDQDRCAPLRRPDISFSHGAEWNALISRYIQAIPFSGDA